MPTPGEQLGDIKEALGDLPQRLASVLASATREAPRIPTAALAPPSIQRSPPPGIPTASPAPGSPPPPIPPAPSPPEPPPLPKKYPRPAAEAPELPEWWKSVRDQKRQEDHRGMGFFKAMNTPMKDLFGMETPEQQRGWKKQEDKAVAGFHKANNVRAAREYDAMQRPQPEVKQVGSEPVSPGSEGGGGMASQEIVDLLTEIRDAVKTIAERPKDHSAPTAHPQGAGGSPGFKTVYQAPTFPRGGQSSRIGAAPKTSAGGSKNNAANAAQTVKMAETLGPLLAGS